jgi:hypothetical protein
MLALLALALAPLLVQRARKRDQAAAQAQAAAGELPVVMSQEQAYARHLYGEAYGWGKLDMINYDQLPFVREPWERVAQGKINAVAHQAAG